MTFKIGKIYIILFVLFTIIWAQQTNAIAQKISIENSYQQKILTNLSPLLGDEKLLVIVSIEFSTIGGVLKKNTDMNSGNNINGTYIPGLPTVPSTQNKNTKFTRQGNSTSDLNIGRVDVIIGMDESSITPSIKPQIISLVQKIIPNTKECEDCIKIEAMQFQTGQKNKRLTELEEKIELLEKEKREADLIADQVKIDDLEEKLNNAETARKNYEAIDNIRKLEAYRQDSIRFQNFLKAEQNRRMQDSIKFINTEKRLERVMESKIKSDSTIISEQMSIVKKQAGISDDGGSLFGNSNMMTSILIIFLIISLMIVTFLAANNRKPKTIYLKPKISKDKKDKQEKNDTNESVDDNKDTETNNESTPQEITPKIKQDEDALRSELKSLRQTAVSLTVGEKEGASALIKEWLEDNPNKEENSENTEE